MKKITPDKKRIAVWFWPQKYYQPTTAMQKACYVKVKNTGNSLLESFYNTWLLNKS
jgi:hypothetical protein